MTGAIAAMISTDHTIQSSYREMVLEHLFVGEVMRYCWAHGLPRIEMLKSQVDNSGYDIVLESCGVMRHVQLKASYAGARTARVNVNVALAEKSSGCVIWLIFEPNTLEFTQFLWLGVSRARPCHLLKSSGLAVTPRGTRKDSRQSARTSGMCRRALLNHSIPWKRS